MISALQDKLPKEANDIKLNLEAVLSVEGAPGLSQNQIHGIALASAYATKNSTLIEDVKELSGGRMSEEETTAAKSAAIIMAMNNVYYRAIHLAEDEDLGRLPARLRMNVIGRPGIAKLDFELYCVAVSAINGCGKCIQSHVNELKKTGASHEAIQSSLRIAAVIAATAQALT